MKIKNLSFKKKLLHRAILVLVLLIILNQTKLNAQNIEDEIEAESEKVVSFDEKIGKTKQLIVMVKVELDGSQVIGAGILVGREKNELWIVTAYHLLHRGTIQASKIEVKFRAQPGKFLEAAIANHGNEEEMDWALLSVKDLSKAGIDICSVKFDRLGDVTTLKRSDEVFPLGNPNGIEWAMPVVGDKVSDIIGNDIVFQSAFISNGNSGGALIDSNANIIGMIVKDQPPFGRAIKIDTLLETVPIHCQLHGDYRWTKLSLLHVIANEGNLEWIKYLLTDNCYDVNMQEAYGRTPLYYTAGASLIALPPSEFSLEAMKLLVRAGADINALDADEMSPLDYSVSNGRIDQVKFLVKAGANVNGNSKKTSPLLFAIRNGQVAIISFLMESGASIKKSTDEQVTPLHAAIENLDWKTGYYGTTDSAIEIVQMLIKAGADVNAKSHSGETPLHEAAKSSAQKVIKELLKAGANVNAKDNEGITPLDNAISNVEHDHLTEDYGNSIELLLEAGADVDITDTNGKTSFDYLNEHLSNYTNYKDVRELLIKHSHKYK